MLLALSHLINVIKLLTMLLYDCPQLTRILHININFLLESDPLPPPTARYVESHYASTVSGSHLSPRTTNYFQDKVAV